MRLLYSLILYLLCPFVLLRLFWLGLRNRSYWQRWRERFGYISPAHAKKPVIWLHAVSVGEVQAATPLIHRIFSDHPGHQVVMTTVTPTGAEIAEKKFGKGVVHYYLPYDLPSAINRFLNHIRPKILVVMETELWPNLYHQCHKRGIPILLVNGRLSQKSYLGYKRLASLTKQVLSKISMIAVQSKKDGERLISLGAGEEKVIVTGSMKFDMNIPHSVFEQAQSQRRFFSVNRPVWIAASTHEGEEEIVLSVHQRVLESLENCLLLIAPRHPERFEKVSQLSSGYGFNTVNKSETTLCPADVQVFILDTLGELLVYYAASDLAFVGGSLMPFGGHNVLEPASLGIPVITGQHFQNFMEINQLLLNRRAELKISGKQELAEKVILLLSDGNLRHQMGQAGKAIVAENRGSTDKVMELITGTLHEYYPLP